MDPTSVSVIIPTFNAAGFVSRAIQSVQSQSALPVEIIIVDDASTDGTVELLRAHAASDSRIKVICQPHNSGPSAARNTGIDAAIGSWIAILDADDAYLADRLEKLTMAGASENADIIADDILFYEASTGATSGSNITPTIGPAAISIADFLTWARPYTSQTDWGLLKPVFRRSFLQTHAIRYPEYSRHGEDFLILLEALLNGARYIRTPQPGYLYTTRSSGMSRTKVNYQGMSKETIALLKDGRISANPNLVGLVKGRAAAIRRLAAERYLDEALTQRSWLRLSKSVIANPLLQKELSRRVARNLRHRMSRR